MLKLILLLVANFVILTHGGCPHMQKSLLHSKFYYYDTKDAEDRLRADYFTVLKPQPGWDFYYEFSFTDKHLEQIQNASVALMAEQYYSQKFLTGIGKPRLSVNERLAALEAVSECVPKEIRCLPQPTCDASYRYRTINGQCNNLLIPLVGSSYSQYTRLLQAVYDDGLYEERRGIISSERLPSPRVISNAIFVRQAYAETPNPLLNLNGVVWAQLLAHDTGHAVDYGTGYGGSAISCCSADYTTQLPKPYRSAGCEPIIIPRDDPFYSSYNMTCMQFLRARLIQPNDCKLGQAQQLSIVTSFFDASFLYGNTHRTGNILRSFKGGHLNTDKHDMIYKRDNCTYLCYIMGDIRQKNNPTVLSQHVILLRFHNWLADELARLNSHWDDEQLYQEARRIVIAVYQRATVQEWFRIIVGENQFNKYFKCESGRCGLYDEKLNPGILSEFVGSSLRFMHGYFPNHMYFYSNYSHWYRRYEMPDVLTNEALLYPNFLGIIRGAFIQPGLIGTYSVQMRNNIFKGFGGRGIDIASVDIARGRDYGLPPYYQYMEFCEPSAPKINSWDDLQYSMDPDDIEALKAVYDSVYDVDLYVGMYLERKEGYLGPVNKCVFAEQFYRLVYGDRFYFRLKNNPYPFTNDQMDVIDGMTFSRVTCQMTSIDHAPKNAFLVPSDDNPLINCNDFETMDLSSWTENSSSNS